ncbi:YciK family oxidoreductase [Magnetococcales bacterium HHB-1]
MLLKDRIALVTGAGGGIGRAVAKSFAKEGAFVILLGRRQEPLETLFDEIENAGGGASIVPFDLEKDLARASELSGQVRRRFGRLDILVNNAAILGTLTPMSAYTPEMWESVFRINVTAPYFLTQQLLPMLQKSDSASVINVSSSVAQHGRAFWGAYAASKAAFLNMTQTWAQELENTNIRINSLNPGATATAMRTLAFPGERADHLPTPEDLLPVFLYLASSQSEGVTGEMVQAKSWLKAQEDQA